MPAAISSGSPPSPAISYPADIPHVFEALEPGTWATLMIEYT
jgi:hypothetical protein